MARRDLRRNNRTVYTGLIEVSWVEGSEDKFTRGRCVDLSEDGLLLELPVSIQVRTMVTLRFDRIQLGGTASVRHARRAGVKFRVGLELSQHLKQQVARNLKIIQALSSPSLS
jgi:hypothetical protein